METFVVLLALVILAVFFVLPLVAFTKARQAVCADEDLATRVDDSEALCHSDVAAAGLRHSRAPGADYPACTVAHAKPG
ncbi:MAG: hypothetical protein FJ404_18345 [Verrucomicrobia bacterium]|nr:hypothetical protein [Verrucomicrobiota bacterium]